MPFLLGLNTTKFQKLHFQGLIDIFEGKPPNILLEWILGIFRIHPINNFLDFHENSLYQNGLVPENQENHSVNS